MSASQHSGKSGFRPSNHGFWLGFWAVVAIVLYFLLTEHQAHTLDFLPYLLLLACPLMHFFMHGRHGRHRHHHAPETRTPRAPDKREESVERQGQG